MRSRSVPPFGLGGILPALLALAGAAPAVAAPAETPDAPAVIPAPPPPMQVPSFDCAEAEGEVPKLICADSTLAALDVRLDEVWRQVLERSRESPDEGMIRAEQRGWIKGRDDCWKSDDEKACVREAYVLRIAELQARWDLVLSRGPYFFARDDDPADEIVATFFETDPPTALLERGDETVVAFQVPSASGARYEGRNVTFRTKGDEARVTWGWGGEEARYARRGGSAGD